LPIDDAGAGDGEEDGDENDEEWLGEKEMDARAEHSRLNLRRSARKLCSSCFEAAS
jgi:hypothetical protein